MGRISNTIGLAKVSWGVLRKDRELLVLPVLSFLVSIVVLAVLWVPTLISIDTSVLADETSQVPSIVPVVGVLSALALGVVSVFFTGALVAGAHERLTGGDPTVGSALGRAMSRLPGLVPWALLTATVGLVLQALRERAGGLGRFVVGMIGMAWDVATFLVIPAIVIDDHGPVSGLKASAAHLKRTWGENIAARVGFGFLGLFAMLPVVALLFIMGALGSAAFAVGIAISVVWVAAVMVVLSALGAVFQTALYLYATTGTVPSGFEQSSLTESFGAR
ncbi:MAG: hypothetical protein H8E59_09810 [Actinobacteria bacterium]|nr:hypothetical protein [Actinomycetota bacterium]